MSEWMPGSEPGLSRCQGSDSEDQPSCLGPRLKPRRWLAPLLAACLSPVAAAGLNLSGAHAHGLRTLQRTITRCLLTSPKPSDLVPSRQEGMQNCQQAEALLAEFQAQANRARNPTCGRRLQAIGAIVLQVSMHGGDAGLTHGLQNNLSQLRVACDHADATR